MKTFVTILEEQIAEKWNNIVQNSLLSKTISSGDYDVRIYAIYLIETFHYTIHNSRNQALVGASLELSADIQYLRFCLKHAYEEAGHELMALHDLKTLGLDILPTQLPTPLPSNEILIAYLYRVSNTGNLKARLGYSLWAENAYEHISPLLSAVQKKLSLKPAQMTFLGEHADIDEKHIKEVRNMIQRLAVTNEDKDAITNVALNSLELTARMLDEVAAEYLSLKNNNPSKYSFLNELI